MAQYYPLMIPIKWDHLDADYKDKIILKYDDMFLLFWSVPSVNDFYF